MARKGNSTMYYLSGLILALMLAGGGFYIYDKGLLSAKPSSDITLSNSSNEGPQYVSIIKHEPDKIDMIEGDLTISTSDLRSGTSKLFDGDTSTAAAAPFTKVYAVLSYKIPASTTKGSVNFQFYSDSAAHNTTAAIPINCLEGEYLDIFINKNCNTFLTLGCNGKKLYTFNNPAGNPYACEGWNIFISEVSLNFTEQRF